MDPGVVRKLCITSWGTKLQMESKSLDATTGSLLDLVDSRVRFRSYSSASWRSTANTLSSAESVLGPLPTSQTTSSCCLVVSLLRSRSALARFSCDLSAVSSFRYPDLSSSSWVEAVAFCRLAHCSSVVNRMTRCRSSITSFSTGSTNIVSCTNRDFKQAASMEFFFLPRSVAVCNKPDTSISTSSSTSSCGRITRRLTPRPGARIETQMRSEITCEGGDSSSSAPTSCWEDSAMCRPTALARSIAAVIHWLMETTKKTS
mmetsp:Transcript_49138/g.111253  ORF Transcript_49138/g.111253 Transcript_49138/m.111253 type:complete len:260 (+) Transcript_49138:2756-3535(+)